MNNIEWISEKKIDINIINKLLEESIKKKSIYKLWAKCNFIRKYNKRKIIYR